MLALLYGYRGDCGQGLLKLMGKARQVADDQDLGVPGDGEVGLHDHSSQPVQFGACAARQYLCQRGSPDACRPQHRMGLDFLCMTGSRGA